MLPWNGCWNEESLEKHGEDSRGVAELRRQIAARDSGQSAQELYITGSVAKLKKETQAA
jgi:hypothetical protein